MSVALKFPSCDPQKSCSILICYL